MKWIIRILCLSALVYSCRDIDVEEEIEELIEAGSDSIDTSLYSDWTEATHGADASLDYDEVFNQTKVLRFDITIDEDDWADMYSDLAANIGSSNTRPGARAVSTLTSDYDPIWVPCDIEYEGRQWYQVGIRFKGNSSLQTAYQSGNGKLSLKLDFDEFEDDNPGLSNQRFYGFRQLNLNNNYNDASLMREKMGADLFRAFGLPAAQTAFCVVYVDFGNGPQYFGVYTIVEEVDDTVLETQFADGTGNLYKPDGDAASFANGTYDITEMYLKTNEDSATYSDVEALYEAINSSLRTSDVDAWKAQLESVLDVDHFLKWLAANIVIQNWDTYGIMTHNYYLYNSSESNLMTWIPWDNNEAFQTGKQGGALSFALSEVSSSWPLISYITADSDYKAIYESYLQKFVDEVYIYDELSAKYDEYYALLKDYAYAEESGYTYISRDSYFDSAVETLKSHITSRNSAVSSYLK